MGEGVTYSFGAGSLTDTSGSSGPDVFRALGNAVQINLVVPAGATGNTVTVSTAGGSVTLTLADVSVSSVAAEVQGSVGTDGVGNTILTATPLTVGSEQPTDGDGSDQQFGGHRFISVGGGQSWRDLDREWQWPGLLG